MTFDGDGGQLQRRPSRGVEPVERLDGTLWRCDRGGGRRREARPAEQPWRHREVGQSRRRRMESEAESDYENERSSSRE